MKALIPVVCGLLISCGSLPEGENSAAAPSSNDARIDHKNPDTSDTEDSVMEESTSFYVADAGARPPCIEAKEGFLVYLGAEKKLQACNKGQWVDLDLPAGKDGVDGVDGVAGAKGEKGDPGEDGEDGVDGQDGLPVAQNTWIDPVSGQLWFMGGTSNGLPGSACSGEWRLPTFAEVSTASSRGMFPALSSMMGGVAAYECAWHSSGGLNATDVKPGANCTGGHALPFGIYCTKDVAP